MKIIDAAQGSPQWLAHRAQHFNASDAPAMMGVSPYKTRAELIREYATGLTAEVDAATQHLFDMGHRAEALARPLAEQIIGEALYPITASEGKLSASYDGITFLYDVALEHKSLNAMLREALPQKGLNEGVTLPLLYRVQMEQQCLVAGCERILFMASEWTDDGVLVEERHCWYTPDPELRAKIVAGWEQFEADVAAYVPAEAAPVVVAAPQEHLPAVSVQVTGTLAVVSNLQPFGAALRAFVERIPKAPSTDQEFADTEAACKRLKEAEDRLQQAEDSALASMADVEQMRRTIAELRELARTTRLASEKLVKQRKEQIREEEVQRGKAAFAAHFKALTDRLGYPYIPPIETNFAGVIKGLKTLDSVRNAIDTELARAKIEASALADKIEVNLKAIDAASMPHLFNDKAMLVLKDADDLAAIIAQRVQAEKQRIEAERERIRQQEQERAAQAPRSESEREGTGSVEVPVSTPEAAPPINLGEIARRLGFTLTREFIEGTLGIQHTKREKAAYFWPASAFGQIRDALIQHLRGCR